MVRASRGRGVLCRGRAAAGSGLLLLTALLSMFGRTNAADDGIQSTPVMGAFLFHAFWFLDSLPPGLCHGRGGTGSGDPGARLLLCPMAGWSTWYATGGNLSEAVVLDVAARMVQTGLRDAGYVFVSPAAGKTRGRVALRVGSGPREILGAVA